MTFTVATNTNKFNKYFLIFFDSIKNAQAKNPAYVRYVIYPSCL